MQNLHLLPQTFSQARHASGTHQINGLEPPHTPYSKRAMAKDQADLMQLLGYESFFVAGHDRGARVAHRLARDYPNAVAAVSFLDIIPTERMYAQTERTFATGYYHWFFLIQPTPLPERLIGNDPGFYSYSLMTLL